MSSRHRGRKENCAQEQRRKCEMREKDVSQHQEDGRQMQTTRALPPCMPYMSAQRKGTTLLMTLDI
ncbi:hypothetical protein D918_05754 [Trichuris suis]|nr:hypothetical protein D918_05754 [Trichuris suis]